MDTLTFVKLHKKKLQKSYKKKTKEKQGKCIFPIDKQGNILYNKV